MPQNSNFRLPRDHRFFPKNGSYGYGDKSRWGPSGSILTPMGSQWVKKMVQKCKKITMPQNANFRLPCDHRFFLKNGSYGYGDKSRWGPRRVPLGANGVPLGPKNGSKPYKITMPLKFKFSTTPRSSIFPQKWKLRLWHQITVGTP